MRKTEDYDFEVTVIAPGPGGVDVEATVNAWCPRMRSLDEAIERATTGVSDVIVGARVVYHADGSPKVVRTNG